MQSTVCKLAKEAHRQYFGRGKSVSRQTRKAHLTCREWQNRVLKKYPERFEPEVTINANGTGQRIDLVDRKDRTAYELKASPHNVQMEIYRDVFKALVYNVRNPQKRLRKLVFIAPSVGIEGLGRDFTRDVAAISKRLELSLVLVGI